jgi:hypothetical protein
MGEGSSVGSLRVIASRREGGGPASAPPVRRRRVGVDGVGGDRLVAVVAHQVDLERLAAEVSASDGRGVYRPFVAPLVPYLRDRPNPLLLDGEPALGQQFQERLEPGAVSSSNLDIGRFGARESSVDLDPSGPWGLERDRLLHESVRLDHKNTGGPKPRWRSNRPNGRSDIRRFTQGSMRKPRLSR